MDLNLQAYKGKNLIPSQQQSRGVKTFLTGVASLLSLSIPIKQYVLSSSTETQHHFHLNSVHFWRIYR